MFFENVDSSQFSFVNSLIRNFGKEIDSNSELSLVLIGIVLTNIPNCSNSLILDLTLLKPIIFFTIVATADFELGIGIEKCLAISPIFFPIYGLKDFISSFSKLATSEIFSDSTIDSKLLGFLY